MDFCFHLLTTTKVEKMAKSAAHGLATGLRCGAILDDGNMGAIPKKSLIQAYYFCQRAGVEDNDVVLSNNRFDLTGLHNGTLTNLHPEQKLYYLYFKSFMEHKLNPTPQSAEALELIKSLAQAGLVIEVEQPKQKFGLFT